MLILAYLAALVAGTWAGVLAYRAAWRCYYRSLPPDPALVIKPPRPLLGTDGKPARFDEALRDHTAARRAAMADAARAAERDYDAPPLRAVARGRR